MYKYLAKIIYFSFERNLLENECCKGKDNAVNPAILRTAILLSRYECWANNRCQAEEQGLITTSSIPTPAENFNGRLWAKGKF